MGSRNFVGASSNRISSSIEYLAALGSNYTQLALVTRANLTAFQCAFALNNAVSTSRQAGTWIDGSGDDSVGATCRTTDCFGNTVDPPVDIPHIIGHTKDSGTTTPTVFMLNLVTGVFTSAAGSVAVAGRTSGSVTVNIGSWNAADFWSGHIYALGIYNRILSAGELLSMRYGRQAWRALFGQGVLSSDAELFIDLTIPGTVRDQLNPQIAFTGTGTNPAFGPTGFNLRGW